MSTWLLAVLPVVSALLGVIAGNWATTRRESVARLWEQRVKTYLDLIDWADKVEKAFVAESGEIYHLSGANFESVQQSDELKGRVWAFPSRTVGSLQSYSEQRLNALQKLPEPYTPTFPDPRSKQLEELRDCLLALRKAIRLELSSGRLRAPLDFRIREGLKRRY